MAAETEALTAHTPLALAETLDAVAARLERPRGRVREQALAACTGQEEGRRRWTPGAPGDVDADRVIDPLAITAWAGSPGTDEGRPSPIR
jgi:predicted transcriptional regulator